jgi:uncharacterized protein YggU (UPF0235/DUF167 family)
LTPKGGRDALSKYEAGVLTARVAAAPVDGAANQALIALLAKKLAIAKSRIAFRSGETGRDKALRIEGLNQDDLEALLQRVIEEK